MGDFGCYFWHSRSAKNSIMDCQDSGPILRDILVGKDIQMDEEIDISSLTPEQLMELAEEKKAAGNELYKSKNYKDALSLYSEAIDLCPQCAAFYGNRAATLIMLARYKQALEDARRATELDPNFVKCFIRQAKCLLTLGDALSAEIACQKAREIEPANQQVQNDLNTCRQMTQLVRDVDTDFNKGEHRRALFYLDRLLQMAPQSLRFKTRRAEALVYLRRYAEASDTINDVVQRDGLNADAIFIRGLCMYYQDSIDKAFNHFQQVLRLAPDHQAAKDTYKKVKLLRNLKEKGNDHFRGGKYQDAYDTYTEALNVDPYNVFTNSKLYCNRATVCSKLSKTADSIDDCTKAIELDEKYTKAYLRRAKSYMETEQYEEAVRDYEYVFKMDKSREHKRILEEAKLELKKSKRKDYYKILGVEKSANQTDIKKAYKKRALIHHPDRHSHATPEEQNEEERKFKEVGEAYGVLSDEKKRGRYDNGLDLEDLDGGFGAEMDPNAIFQAFFGGGGGGFGGPGGGFGHSHGGGPHFFTHGGGGGGQSFHFQF